MNSESGKHYMDRLKKQNEQEIPMVQIPRAEWEQLKRLLSEKEHSIKEMKQTIRELTETSKREIRKIASESERQVGRASERASEYISRRAIREEAMWWLKLILFALPLILLLAWGVYYGTLGTLVQFS